MAEPDSGSSRVLSGPLFNYPRLTVLTVGFVGLVFGLHWVTLRVCQISPFDCPASWPISIFHYVGPTTQRLLTAAAVGMIFLGLIAFLERFGYRLAFVIVA